jgi:hypothetical protein
MYRQKSGRFGDRLPVRVQVSLSRRQRPVPSDLPKAVYGDASASRPGQTCMPLVVTPQVFIAERGHHFVPVSGVAQNGRRDPPTA